MSWRLAKSLGVLGGQVDQLAPNRSKRSDGTIGDTAHAARRSDHNPDEQGIVRARDITHDPDKGADMRKVTEQLRISKDARIKYVIFDGRMFSSYSNSRRQAWEWGEYTGSNPHKSHAHISVVPTATADQIDRWAIEGGEDTMTITQGARGQFVGAWQAALNIAAVRNGIMSDVFPLDTDDVYGADTTAAVKAYQTAANLPVTGDLDDHTRDLLVINVAMGVE